MAEAPTKQPKILFAMLRRTEDPAKLKEMLPRHLEWMKGREKQGDVFLSGPTEPADGSAVSGITVIQAESREAAEAIAKEDPVVQAGVVTYALHSWTVNEGRIALRLDLSDHSIALG